LLSQDVEIPVIGANFVKDILWPVPLIEHILNHVLVSIKPKTNRPLVRLPCRVAIDFHVHLFLMRAYNA
jgi:hypothetical protein